uniref:Uncharacterized protein n=1 Tax=Anguilla anguilla TaxID=7936 RepID=A0A0E9U2F0_ANGAN
MMVNFCTLFRFQVVMQMHSIPRAKFIYMN